MTAIWEDQISLHSRVDPVFETVAPADTWVESDAHPTDWASELGDITAELSRDQAVLPTTPDREGYFGPHHFSYWASGLRDHRNLMECTQRLKLEVGTYLDLGCASGRVIRHFASQTPDIRTLGCDINRKHVEWVAQFLDPSVVAFQNTSIPNLPLADGSVDLVSAFSVFTHIEALETTWLMELDRILAPGGVAWITVHTEDTWLEMGDGWPLYNAIKNHPEFEGNESGMDRDRVVFRWKNDRSYSSNVFYTWAYLERVWGRIFDIVETHRRLPVFQDVLVLRKKP